jgi:hypothetical protein
MNPKFSIKNYYSLPTPVKWRKIGDSVLIAGTTIMASTLAMESKWLMAAGLVLVVGGKILTNFFGEQK